MDIFFWGGGTGYDFYRLRWTWIDGGVLDFIPPAKAGGIKGTEEEKEALENVKKNKIKTYRKLT